MSTVENSAATSAVSSRVLRLTLLFAFLATVFDGVELNLLSYPLVYISGTFGVSTQADPLAFLDPRAPRLRFALGE